MGAAFCVLLWRLAEYLSFLRMVTEEYIVIVQHPTFIIYILYFTFVIPAIPRCCDRQIACVPECICSMRHCYVQDQHRVAR